MVIVFVTNKLEKEINKRLSKNDANNCFKLIYSLENNPSKGNILTIIGNVILKEIRLDKYRFYFIHSSKVFKCLSKDELKNEILKFIAMSNKSNEQQKVIDRIKKDLRDFDFNWF